MMFAVLYTVYICYFITTKIIFNFSYFCYSYNLLCFCTFRCIFKLPQTLTLVIQSSASEFRPCNVAGELQPSATDDVSSWSASSAISYFTVAYMMTVVDM